ncbi:helix-turn-helix domain-containing protein [Streptomyces angustmyceticus]|uniref:helix-turn-helix domain-containing protein n=1 Tax=Streptomyces angustmyceticus TaxID=285578 RepID=UPI003813DF2C
MPRWKALPEELDPQVGEFTGQLRRLVDRSGLSVATVADRTGYSKTSWERYLNGRLLPPLRAVVALAETTGAQPAHLTTLWELAERAWSRAEMRQDVTMEAISVAQARAALGELDADTAQTGPEQKSAKTAAKAAKAGKGAKAGAAAPDGPPAQEGFPHAPSSADFPEWQGAAAPAPAPPAARRARRGRTAVFAAGAVGALLVAGGAVLLLKPSAGPPKKVSAAAAPAAAPSAQPTLPTGVRCTGDGCVGKDPEKMGCGGTHATTSSRGVAGRSVIEVRYSAVCHTAWARISRAARGDQATISAGGHSATAQAERAGDAYTPMVAVSGDPAKVAACQTTMAGAKSCARPVPATPAAGGPVPATPAAGQATRTVR